MDIVKKPNKSKDPHLSREAAKYDNPIPSREFISEHLEKRSGPATHPELCDELGLTHDDDIEALRRRLIAMVRDGQLLCSRRGAFGLIDKMDLVRGRVQGHPDGYGFLIPDLGGQDYLLNHRQMNCCFDGDIVLARKGRRDHRGRTEAIITEVLERNTVELVGRFHWDGSFGVVHPENKRIAHDVLIPPKNAAGAEDGDIVVVEILEQPQFRKQPIGKVLQVLGAHMAPGMEIDIALRTYDIPHTWPFEVEEQIVGFSDQVEEADKANRVDLRDKPFVTIDGEDARDFDDAVFAQKMVNGGVRLYVAIADVSHYVPVDSPLDHEARSRGTSVYFPEQVIPMLPEVLSNGLCSLNPQTDRLALVCEMEVSSSGEVNKFRFMEGLIHSHARLTYTQVGEYLEAEKKVDRKPFIEAYGKEVARNIDMLHELYRRFRIARTKRGAIEYETREARIIFNEDRKIERIVATERNDAHRLIEECMLAANVSAATLLETLKIPCLYRVHDAPSFERLENLREYMGEQGLALGGGLKPKASDYQTLLSQISGREDFQLLQTVMLRSMAQAVYQPDNIGHFGLAFDRYAHFTSPIRRYPDLLVHRAIRSVIRDRRRTSLVKRVKGAPELPKSQIYPYDEKAMFELGEHCSMTERRADEATWDVMAWLKCEYMSDHIGEEFNGTISSVTNFGLFVQLDDVYVDGLVHISSLQSDYYQYQASAHRLVGDRTRITYSLGDKLKVKVVRVSLDERKIDFELADNDIVKPSRNRRKAKNSQGSHKGKKKNPAKNNRKSKKH
ncbi:ribonuclease R [Reinekea blandensis]|uniref:Ribonuclease R n=1 Tax=Reinekea blandensis MED297 TaxID=314283 RepID=A4BEC0_9GAMM|nr:ribonuclease R [Reinekea blandensis]EAR09598.1 ribonuclease R [Reinekea blandensis MED297]